MIESIGWDWQNADKTTWLKPTEDSYYLANKWKEKEYKRILDLGTGLGRHAIFFAQQGFEVSAIDLSDYSTEHLKSWAKNEKLNINVIKGDMLSLPYSENSFDCVFAYHVISHTDINGLKQTISEIERVLNANGEIFLSLISKETPSFLDKNAQRIDENTIISQDEFEYGIPHVFVDLDDILNLFTNFDIEKVRKTQYCRLNGENYKAGHHFYINAVIKCTE